MLVTVKQARAKRATFGAYGGQRGHRRAHRDAGYTLAKAGSYLRKGAARELPPALGGVVAEGPFTGDQARRHTTAAQDLAVVVHQHRLA